MRRAGRVTGALVMATVMVVAVMLSASVVAVATSAEETLRRLFERHGRFVGTGVDGVTLVELANSFGAYDLIVGAEFGALVPHREFGWDATEPSRGSFNFQRAEPIVGYAAQHGQTLVGQGLLGQGQLGEENLPGWVAAAAATATAATAGEAGGESGGLRSIMTDHIAGVVGHFRGAVARWDVVGTPFNDDGSLRQTPFARALGEEYVAEALRAAHAADPEAKLYLSDQGLENAQDAAGAGASTEAMFQLVTSLQAHGVPLDGIALRGRFALGAVPADLATTLRRFTDLGLEVTLVDVEVRVAYPADSVKLSRQAAEYTQIVRACLEVPRCVGINVRGVRDSESDVVFEYPGFGRSLLLDDEFNRKPAYHGMVEGFGGG